MMTRSLFLKDDTTQLVSQLQRCNDMLLVIMMEPALAHRCAVYVHVQYSSTLSVALNMRWLLKCSCGRCYIPHPAFFTRVSRQTQLAGY